MQTYSEMQAELVSRLMTATNSTSFPTSRIQSLIKQAHIWATSLHEWPELVRAKYTTTTTDTYYDYPEEFRTDSIVRVEIDNQEYNKKNYEDFLDYKKKNSGRLQSYTAGLTLDVYGCIQAPDFSESVTTTIFSNSDETGNEAIVKRALSIAIKRSDTNQSIIEENEALQMLETIWKKISQRQHREERLDHPFLNVPVFFGKRNVFEDEEPDTNNYIFADYQRKIFIAKFR